MGPKIASSGMLCSSFFCSALFDEPSTTAREELAELWVVVTYTTKIV